MGNREDLLRGATQCLIERGWAHTTVRDIAEAAGVNHAAIGYHFGSKDALLTQALVAAMEELSAELARRVPADSPEQRWQALIDTFTTHRRLWVAQLEAAVQAERSPEVREHLVAGQRAGREGLGGSVPLALLTGLMLQWLVDPERAPDAAEALAELRALTVDALFVYGTLAPGEANAHVLADVPGDWRPAAVRGRLVEEGWGADLGFPAIILDDDGPEVPGLVFSSAHLADHWSRLDAFEGDAYERVRTTARHPDGRTVEVYVYALAKHRPDPSPE